MNNLDRWHRDQQLKQLLQSQSRDRPILHKPAPKPDLNDRLKSIVWLATFVIGALMLVGLHQVAEMIWRVWL